MKKNNQLKAGVILSYLQTGLNALISLAYTPIMLRLLGASEYGVYTLVSSVISSLGLLNFGFSSSYVRFYSRYRAKNDHHGLARLNGLFLLVYSVLALIAFGAGLFISANVDFFFGAKYTAEELEITGILLTILSFNLMLTFLTTPFTAYVSANERFVFQKVLNMGKTVFSPLLTIPVLLMGFRSVGVVVVTTVVSVLVDLSNILFCLKKLKMRFAIRGAEFRLIGEIASFSVFIAINSIVDQINWQVDKVILSSFHGTVATAVYGVAAQINTLYISVSTSISNVFIPRVHRIAQKSDCDRQFTRLMTKIGRVQMLVLGLVGSGLALFGSQFIRIWAGEQYAEAYPIMLLLVLPGTIPLIQNIGIEIQRAKNMHQFRSVAYLFMALFNVGLSVVLGSRYEGLGCALGTAIAMLAANGLIMNWYYWKKIGLDMVWFWKRICSMLPAILAAALVGWLIFSRAEIGGYVSLICCAGLYTCVYAVICWLFAMDKSEKDLICGILRKVLRR